MSGSPGVHEPLFSRTWTLQLYWLKFCILVGCNWEPIDCSDRGSFTLELTIQCLGSLSHNRITCRFHDNTPTLQTILQMQNVDSSIKSGRRLPQRPAPLARVDPACPTAPLYCSWDVFCCHQVSAQSLEAMAFIIPESAGRISEFCMHFACDFTVGAAHYTIPAYDRRLPARLSSSQLSLQVLDAGIIQFASFSTHST